MPALALFLHLLAIFLPAALAQDAILKVTANTDGAEVFVDGASLGKAPLTKYLPAGSHQLRVVADRFDPFVRRVDLVADRTLDVKATLAPGQGTVEFTGPAGARVTLDGADRGPLPIRLGALAVGKHTWQVDAPGFESSTGELDFLAGRNFLVDVKLASSAGVWVIASTPPGARVRLDGTDVGVTPLRLTGIPVGRHGVELSLAGRALVARSVDTSDGTRGDVTVTLPESGGSLTVSTGDEAAVVFLNDAPVGTGSTVKVGPIEKGRAKVRVSIGDRVATDTVSVPAHGNVSLRLAGDSLVERKPLPLRWGFWAAVGGGVAAGVTGVAIIAAATEPEPPPAGDTVVPLP